MILNSFISPVYPVRRSSVILRKSENIKYLLAWCQDHGYPQITAADLKECNSRDLQIARRAACFHGSIPRKIREIARRKRLACRQPYPDQAMVGLDSIGDDIGHCDEPEYTDFKTRQLPPSDRE